MALDYYAVLGLKNDASADELRKAYKKLSRENHPDRKPNDAAAGDIFDQYRRRERRVTLAHPGKPHESQV